jgi:hypothetical protein
MDAKKTPRWTPLLGYSTNVHRGETLAQVYRFLGDYTVPINRRVFGAGARAGLELRLGIGSARELAKRAARERFRAFLEENGLLLFSVNAFPLLDFHARRVKEKVYAPAWTEAARGRWTNAIADILADLLPAGVTGSISTLGGAFRHKEHGAAALRKIAANYARTAGHLAGIEERTGKTILLAAEPEPETTFETSRDVIEFFERWLIPAARAVWGRRMRPARIEERLRRFFTVNCDACHASVLFEDPVESLRSLWRAGIEVGKLHVTSAVALPNPFRARKAYADLLAMDEPRYFHQFAGRGAGGKVIWRGLDLDRLPRRLERGKHPPVSEIRSHYHVPLYLRKWRSLDTTRDETRRAVREAARAKRTSHLVVETYTWPILAREEKLIEGIAREIEWLLQTLSGAGTALPPIGI